HSAVVRPPAPETGDRSAGAASRKAAGYAAAAPKALPAAGQCREHRCNRDRYWAERSALVVRLRDRHHLAAPLIPTFRAVHDPYDREHDRHFDENADDSGERRARMETE